MNENDKKVKFWTDFDFYDKALIIFICSCIIINLIWYGF